MTFTMERFIVFLLYLSLTSALAFDAPVATPVWQGLQLQAQGWSPKPTKAPSLDDLRKRQTIQNLILASDGTCGYVSGISGNFWRCLSVSLTESATQRLPSVSVAAHVLAALRQRRDPMVPFTAATLRHARAVFLRPASTITDFL
jgi:hypothetical protein